MLCPCPRIKAHNKVVAGVVFCGLGGGGAWWVLGFWQEEGAPVCDAADDAEVLQYERPGCFGDLFYFVEAAGADLGVLELVVMV